MDGATFGDVVRFSGESEAIFSESSGMRALLAQKNSVCRAVTASACCVAWGGRGVCGRGKLARIFVPRPGRCAPSGRGLGCRGGNQRVAAFARLPEQSTALIDVYRLGRRVATLGADRTAKPRLPAENSPLRERRIQQHNAGARKYFPCNQPPHWRECGPRTRETSTSSRRINHAMSEQLAGHPYCSGLVFPESDEPAVRLVARVSRRPASTSLGRVIISQIARALFPSRPARPPLSWKNKWRLSRNRRRRRRRRWPRNCAASTRPSVNAGRPVDSGDAA